MLQIVCTFSFCCYYSAFVNVCWLPILWILPIFECECFYHWNPCNVENWSWSCPFDKDEYDIQYTTHKSKNKTVFITFHAMQTPHIAAKHHYYFSLMNNTFFPKFPSTKNDSFSGMGRNETWPLLCLIILPPPFQRLLHVSFRWIILIQQ